MATFLPLLPLLGALALGAISPGPSFLFVARTAVGGSRANGLAAAAGMGTGAVLFALVVIGGHETLLTRYGWLFASLKVLGAIYLLFLAVGMWRDAGRPLAEPSAGAPEAATARRAFVAAFLTQVSNPKALVVYGSIFAALLPRDLPRPVLFVLPVLVFAIEAGWYAVVALGLSARSPRAAYLRGKPLLDRVVASVLGLVGLRLLVSAATAD